MIREPKEIESILLQDCNVKVWDEYLSEDKEGKRSVGVVLKVKKGATKVHLDLEELEEIVAALRESHRIQLKWVN